MSVDFSLSAPRRRQGAPAPASGAPASPSTLERSASRPPLWLTLFCVCGLGAAGLLGGGPAPRADARTALAVYPFWWSQGRIWTAARAAGAVVDAGAAPFVLVLRSDQDGLARRARAAGALLVLDPAGLGACGRLGRAL